MFLLDLVSRFCQCNRLPSRHARIGMSTSPNRKDFRLPSAAKNTDWPVKPSSIIGAKFVLVRRFRNHFPSTCDVVGGQTGKWLSSNFAQIRKLAPRSSSLRAISRISSHSGQFHFPVSSSGPSDYLKPESGLGRTWPWRW